MEKEFEVSYVQQNDVVKIQANSGVLREIVIDSRNVPPENRGGNASTLLVASALTCFCGTLREALEARNIPFRRIKATGKGVKKDNSVGTVRLTNLDINVIVDIDDQYAEALEHCIHIVKGCMITNSLMEGITVNHNIQRHKS